MKEHTKLVVVARVEKKQGSAVLRIDEAYREALSRLDEFGHCIVVWWADRYEEYRFEIDNIIDLPYAPGERAGLFATRSSVRPNPICINTCKIEGVDAKAGLVRVDEIDAFDGTEVLDIKPYYGCIDRVRDYAQPDWVPGEWGAWYTPIPEVDYTNE